MKKIITVFFICFISMDSFAQMPMGGPPPGMKAPQGKIFGKLIDEDGKPLEYASVVLMKYTVDSVSKQLKEIMFKAQNTELNGEFSFNEVPVMLKLKLVISFVGYKTVEMPIAFALPKMEGMTPPKAGQQMDPAMMAKMMAAFDKDLGKIKLDIDTKELDVVTVTATKALLEMDIDKKTFNVEKNIVTAGGTAVDVMRNIPSIQVDIDGNVKLRNAAPTIFIDSRPTTLSLDQIPADAIEKVEVITNPSAKYDASGSMAGILNIVLKKNKKSGYNGMLNIGTDSNGGSNAMASFSLSQKKWNFSYMGMNMRMRNQTIGASERTTGPTGAESVLNQDIENKTKGLMMFNRLGIDYKISKNTLFSVGTVLGGGSFKPTENIITANNSAGSSFLSNRISESKRGFKPRALQLGFKQSFATVGEELTMDFNMFGGSNYSEGVYTTNYLASNRQITGTQIQKNIGDGSNQFITFQTDYIKPFANGITVETGIRAQINSLQNENNNTLKEVGTEIYKDITSASINYDSKSSVYAAYISLSGKVKDHFSYKIGLRGENSSYNGYLLSSGEKFSNNYPISLFPSVFISKSVSKTDQLQFSITRRVNRPNFFQIIPFIDYTDSLNITRGNPDLVPEFTTSGEISYSKSQGSSTFLVSTYYKQTTNLITRYLNREINPVSGKFDLINTYINANSSTNYGIELTYTNTIKKWWDFTSNINLYNANINTQNIENAVQTGGRWAVFGKVNNNLYLPKNWSIQISADYQGKSNLPVTQNQGFGPPMMQAQSSSQGYIEPFYGVDLAVKKTFLKNDMGSATLSINDIFRSRGNTQVSTGDGFSQTYYRLANPQLIKLNLSFRFGKMDVNLFKKNNTSSMEGMQMQ